MTQPKLHSMGSLICFCSALAIWTAIIAETNPNGSFSYARFWTVLLCWLLFLSGMVLAFLALRRLEHPPARLLSIVLLTLNSVGAILNAFFLVVAVNILDLEHKVKEDEAASLTNAIHLARVEFQSNYTLYATRMSNATEALRSFKNTPASSLRSMEFLISQGTAFSNFLATGVEYSKFYTQSPITFTREVEQSGEPPNVVSNVLRDFRRNKLKLWDEEYAILDKMIQLTSNTLVLNNLMVSNFDQWRISNSVIIFKDANLQREYLETAAKAKQFKSEMEKALEHLVEVQHAPKVPTDPSKQ